MKTLYLLRHAKSSWEHPPLVDFDRPLTDRGYADAHSMGKYMNGKKIEIDVLVSSPAVRAFSTAVIFSRHIKYAADKILIREQLYDSSVKDYLNCIAAVETGNSLLLTGHNNTISDVAQKLSIKGINELKTCAIVAIRFNFDSWKDISTSKGELLFELHPSEIKPL